MTYRRHLARGTSLVELLVTTAVGLLLVIALTYFFIGGRILNRTVDDTSRMQETGRNALELMGRSIRQAGYRANPGFAFSGTAVTGTNGASGAPDSITVRYDAQTGGEFDCTGSSIAAGATVTAAFAITTATNPPALTCNGTAVVDNVENMQISYGIDLSRDGNIESYKTTPTAAEFAQVAAVTVSLLVRSPSTNTATNNQSLTYNGSALPTDGYLRQVYNATFTIRNQAY